MFKFLFKKEYDHSHSFTEVDEKGYQYCVACNYARYVPKENVKCNHKWKIIENNSISRLDVYRNEWRKIGLAYISQCENCGELKSETFKTILTEKKGG